MKKLFILAIASLIGSSAYSQTTTSTTTTTSPLKFGLKVGVNLPKYNVANTDGEDFQTKNTTNFHVTGYLDAPLVGPLYVQPGISLQGKGGKTEYGSTASVEDNSMWVEVPVNFVGKIPLGLGGSNIYLGAGPYVAFGVSGERKGKGSVGNVTYEGNRDLNFGKDSGDDLKGTDLGVNFLGGVQLGSGFNVGAGYGLGLTDLRPTTDGGDGKVTNRVLSFSVGYSF
ncbi:outer membrane beta-barrel protein [Rubrolithibacter danxiaensis]|uniref:outer membrane beta-barrel protein n=1 Tax=Rubrolithibacter danxiaensis TaxID=3390805 RepID=UPI003BF81B56